MTTIHRFGTQSSPQDHGIFPVLVWLLAATLGLAGTPYPAAAQAALGPELVLPSSASVLNPQRVGDSVSAGLVGGVPGEKYRLALLDENGVEVAFREEDADSSGEIALATVWSRTGVDGCDPKPGVAGAPPVSPYSFAEYAEAHAVLVGRVFSLVAIDTSTNALADSEPLVFLPSPDPIYYWSDSLGCRRGYRDLGEPLYLSLYNGHLESAPDSRVWLFERPQDLADWVVGYELEDARGLVFAAGTETELPASTTIYLVGTPVQAGTYLAMVRVEDPSLLEPKRMACDRATINPINYGLPASTEQSGNSDSWACPPCPPST